VLIRAAARFRSAHNGIVSLHCFSAGPNYDPDRLGIGALVGFDEHVLAPGAGFADHAHRAVDIVSWVVEGTLCHIGGSGEVLVRSGQVLVQSCGDGIRHAEANPSASEPLRLIQMTLTGGVGAPAVRLETLPVSLGPGRLTLAPRTRHRIEAPFFVHVLSGTATVDDVELGAGDSLAGDRHGAVVADSITLVWALH